MRSDCLLYLVSPITHKLLYQEGEKLSTLDKTETYSVINDVPILLTDEISEDWRREILEVLFWQYPWVIEEIYAKLDESTSVSEVFVEYIKCFLKDKAGIMSAIRAYSYEKADKWIVSNSGRLIPPDEIAAFEERKSEKSAAAAVAFAANSRSKHLPRYVEEVHSSNPSVILELSTGAGGGTVAVVDKKHSDCIVFTMDIDYVCHANTVSIADYLHASDTLFPVCANFWNMPFANESIDVVCSHFGLDESREINRIIKEISRILKKEGRFINVSRNDALFRQYDLFEPFGFSKEEVLEIMKSARLYADTESLIDECVKHNLILQEASSFEASGECRSNVVSTFISKHTS